MTRLTDNAAGEHPDGRTLSRGRQLSLGDKANRWHSYATDRSAK
jgi:hypothetical protein